ncbi:hypothetical protein JTB14_033485 [Gonioctena quinquepunctata]|nr:hypothetical protein JTB14_033485 [Gonioctena quinquepunctata]
MNHNTDSDPDFVSPSISYDGSQSNFDSDELEYSELQAVPIHDPNIKIVIKEEFEVNECFVDHNDTLQETIQNSRLSSTSAGDEFRYLPKSNRIGKRRKHNCVYCDVLVSNFS